MIVSASRLKGKNHTRCDDSIIIRHTPKWHIIALADGAGSKAKGKEGATLAIRSIAKYLPMLLDTLDNIESLSSQATSMAYLLIEGIKDEFYKRYPNSNIEDFSSTILFAIKSIEQEYWIFGHLGDGVIGAVDRDYNTHTISTPDNGEFVNITYFWNSKDAYKRFRIYLSTGIKGAILMSDGVEAIFYRKSDAKLSKGVSTLFKWQSTMPPKIHSKVLLANLISYAKPKSDDDCTIIMMQNPKDINIPLKTQKITPKDL